ncbi:transthyretin domain protein [Diplocarpon rosae]|nr:transthyretin domain protein [Diplocarpon rosae]
MSTPERPPITCHVLDTMTGRPAAGLDVKLFCTDLASVVFEARTNADGRVAAWEIQLGADGMEGVYAHASGGPVAAMKKIIEEQGQVKESQSRPLGTSLWKLQFNTGAHYGVVNTFFPVVELSFLVKQGEHFHVPLLLGPYSFTTYRGS